VVAGLDDCDACCRDTTNDSFAVRRDDLVVGLCSFGSNDGGFCCRQNSVRVSRYFNPPAAKSCTDVPANEASLANSSKYCLSANISPSNLRACLRSGAGADFNNSSEENGEGAPREYDERTVSDSAGAFPLVFFKDSCAKRYEILYVIMANTN